jgi:putative ABC transport system permease protein
LLRPLPYAESDRLVRVYEKRLKLGRLRNSVSAPDFIDWRSQNHVFEDLAAYTSWDTNLTGGEEPERLTGTVATASLFSVLGVHPAMGRAFLPEEDQPKGNRVVMLSHNLWQRRFGSDQGIVGKSIILNGVNFTVVGVMPSGFEFPSKETELWAPLSGGTRQPLPGCRRSPQAWRHITASTGEHGFHRRRIREAVSGQHRARCQYLSVI